MGAQYVDISNFEFDDNTQVHVHYVSDITMMYPLHSLIYNKLTYYYCSFAAHYRGAVWTSFDLVTTSGSSIHIECPKTLPEKDISTLIFDAVDNIPDVEQRHEQVATHLANLAATPKHRLYT